MTVALPDRRNGAPARRGAVDPLDANGHAVSSRMARDAYLTEARRDQKVSTKIREASSAPSGSAGLLPPTSIGASPRRATCHPICHSGASTKPGCRPRAPDLRAPRPTPRAPRPADESRPTRRCGPNLMLKSGIKGQMTPGGRSPRSADPYRGDTGLRGSGHGTPSPAAGRSIPGTLTGGR